MPNWYAFANAAASESESASVAIFDEIGFWGITAKDFITELSAVKAKTLNLEINSPGGSVFDGIAIFNALRNSGKTINVKVMGVAASIASVIAMAGDKISMPENTFMMVHQPWGVTMGNADDMREYADVLDKLNNSLVSTYVKRTGKSEDDIRAMLSQDTWMSAQEAVDLGFADEVTPAFQATAKFDPTRLPDNVKAIFDAANAKIVEPKAGDLCPIATTSKEINLENHLKCIEVAALGPADPREPSNEFWAAKAQKWGVAEGKARAQLCMNCEHYVATAEMKSCMDGGAGATLKASELPVEPQWADIEGMPAAVCNRWSITCSSLRTCDDWEAGGPITDAPVDESAPAAQVEVPEAKEATDTFADQVAALAQADDMSAYAANWAVAYTKLEEVQAAISEAREIKALCALTKQDASGFINSRTPISDVRAALATKLAEQDESTHVDTTVQNSNDRPRGALPKVINTAALWDAYRKQQGA